MPLATVQQIESINPIPNSDNIVCSKVLGWQVVVRKGEFKPGDLCIFVEIDSLIPRKDWSEFLFKPNTDDKYYRLRTIKLRKQISQGLVLTLDTALYNPRTVGEDVTKELGIEKYEKQLPGSPNSNWAGTRRGRSFPSFLRKTDEVRIQSEPWLIENLKGKPYYITQKLDGTSATFYRWQGKFGVCSRNMQLYDPRTPKGWWKRLVRNFKIRFLHYRIPKTDVYWNMVKKYDIDVWLPEGYAIQGEIVGLGIQGNKMTFKDVSCAAFNLWDIEKQEYKPFDELSNLLYTAYDPVDPNRAMVTVPMLERGDAFSYTMDELLEKAKGKYSNGTSQEGIVVRSLDQSISFKVVNNDFLLKYSE